ncbi:hypothetical protein NEDG_00649 [Nematocida displodere]|uniref:Peptidase C19 ubiquitin carboxyl-terminal hydrolase domain-containing protein n=1 Tax=Nematocida displodere TaxID=1805483 RepID=A0A177ECQ8_9MICR|nr:hypothetical protein NEDG_00649 [Nematocida displodere]
MFLKLFSTAIVVLTGLHLGLISMGVMHIEATPVSLTDPSLENGRRETLRSISSRARASSSYTNQSLSFKKRAQNSTRPRHGADFYQNRKPSSCIRPLPNVGNTCYLNSTLNVFLNIEELTNDILSVAELLPILKHRYSNALELETGIADLSPIFMDTISDTSELSKNNENTEPAENTKKTEAKEAGSSELYGAPDAESLSPEERQKYCRALDFLMLYNMLLQGRNLTHHQNLSELMSTVVLSLSVITPWVLPNSQADISDVFSVITNQFCLLFEKMLPDLTLTFSSHSFLKDSGLEINQHLGFKLLGENTYAFNNAEPSQPTIDQYLVEQDAPEHNHAYVMFEGGLEHYQICLPSTDIAPTIREVIQLLARILSVPSTQIFPHNTNEAMTSVIEPSIDGLHTDENRTIFYILTTDHSAGLKVYFVSLQAGTPLSLTNREMFGRTLPMLVVSTPSTTLNQLVKETVAKSFPGPQKLSSDSFTLSRSDDTTDMVTIYTVNDNIDVKEYIIDIYNRDCTYLFNAKKTIACWLAYLEIVSTNPDKQNILDKQTEATKAHIDLNNQIYKQVYPTQKPTNKQHFMVQQALVNLSIPGQVKHESSPCEWDRILFNGHEMRLTAAIIFWGSVNSNGYSSGHYMFGSKVGKQWIILDDNTIQETGNNKFTVADFGFPRLACYTTHRQIFTPTSITA